MKKTLSPAQIAWIEATAKEITDKPFQTMEFTDAEMKLARDVGLELNIDLDFDFNAAPPLVARPSTSVVRAPCPGTKKMCIRMPNAIIQVFKEEAKLKGVPYQTLMIRALKDSSKRW